MRTKYVAGVSLVLLWGCQNDGGTILGPPANTNTGGTTTSSTSMSGGSSNASGGTSNASGGLTTASGGSAVGGTSSSTGGNATGGKATGGSSATGGASGGNTTGVGGASTSAGGKATTGGATSTGGKATTGGATSTGGKATSGGTTSSGGVTSTGGKATSGGTTSTGGSSTTGPVVASQCGIPAAGATGVAKPSGTAGGIKVIDWAGFKSAISYTFDDSNSSQISNYQALKDTGGRFTFYMQTAKSDASNAIWGTALKDGHELGNHTASHGTSQSDAQTAQTFIQSKFGVTAYAFAAPNGDAATKSFSSMFLTNRSVAGGTIGPGDTSSLSWLPSDIATTSNLAPTAGKWRTICIHGFTGGSDGAYQPIALSSFTTAAKAAVSGGSWVDTVTNIAAYQVGQNALKAGGAKITWSLPTVFPTGKCVRITTSGGTVKQKGTEVPWDDHGYYEISLDAKEVTVE